MQNEHGHSQSDYLALIAKMVSAYKQRTYELMQIQAGDKVLDMGCGPATDTIFLASLVGKAGKVVGVDIDEEQIARAQQRAAEAGVEQWVTHLSVDGQQLPFDPNYFDAARSERVFQHNTDPKRLLKEIIRVTKPGCRVVVVDTDWSTMSIDTDLIDIEQKLKKFHVETVIKNGFSGRKLYRLFLQSGLDDVRVELAPTFVTDYQVSRLVTWYDVTEKSALEAGILSEKELEEFHAELEKADSEGRYFATVLQIIVTGCKPYQ